jgi:hypothetical protein
MSIDIVKAIGSYAVALVVILGGFYMLAQESTPDNTSLLLAGFIGSALTFVFGQEANIRGQRSFQSGLNTPTPPQA